ncbi:hypothetical protein ACFLTZ_04710 [Chloroflexota bacterium]
MIVTYTLFKPDYAGALHTVTKSDTDSERVNIKPLYFQNAFLGIIHHVGKYPVYYLSQGSKCSLPWPVFKFPEIVSWHAKLAHYILGIPAG